MPKSGENISHYKIISAIGAGGMGEVYLAEDTKLDRQIALKILLPEIAKDDDRVRRFVQEAKAASALNHPNILTVYEIGETDGKNYIATEWIEGKTVVYVVAKRAPISTLVLSLAEPLIIRSVLSHKFGYLMALRVSSSIAGRPIL